ncbi:hypothetical protein PENTCL1PPCAC_26680, partial [Pristionchus entomophagus]
FETSDDEENDTNEDGVTLPKRPRMEDLPPHEELQTLFATYNSKESHEDRCGALKKLRSQIAIHWNEIVSTQSIEFNTRFLEDLLQALTMERDAELMKRLVKVTIEAGIRSIDRTTGFQTWSGIVRFMENSFDSDNLALKMLSLSILSKVPNLFGQESPISQMNICLNDANSDMQAATAKWLLAYLRVKEPADLSPFIPIIIQVMRLFVGSRRSWARRLAPTLRLAPTSSHTTRHRLYGQDGRGLS